MDFAKERLRTSEPLNLLQLINEKKLKIKQDAELVFITNELLFQQNGLNLVFK